MKRAMTMRVLTKDDFRRNSLGVRVLHSYDTGMYLCPICEGDASECLHTENAMYAVCDAAEGEPPKPLDPGYPDKPPSLAGDAASRKAAPMFEGLVAYFPNALAYVSHVSKKGNDQHNPGLPMQWSFDKSTDERDCLIRHLAEAGTLDTDGLRHSGKVAWRALANLERELLASDPTLKPGANVRGYK